MCFQVFSRLLFRVLRRRPQPVVLKRATSSSASRKLAVAAAATALRRQKGGSIHKGSRYASCGVAKASAATTLPPLASTEGEESPQSTVVDDTANPCIGYPYRHFMQLLVDEEQKITAIKQYNVKLDEGIQMTYYD